MPFDSLAALHVSQEGDRTVARLPACRLHDDAADALTRCLRALCDGRPGQHLVLDLGRVQSAGGASLGVLVGLHKRLRAAGGRLTLAGLSPLVGEALAVTRLDTLLDIEPRGPGAAAA
jgi:anti-anti-sigma factor